MKYTIESTEKGCIETIELDDGRQYTREHTRTSFGSKCEDLDFSEQMDNNGIADDEFLDKVYDTFDSFLASNFMDMAELEEDW